LVDIYLLFEESGGRILPVRKAITPVIAFVVVCLWLGLLPVPHPHNLLVAFLSVLFLGLVMLLFAFGSDLDKSDR